MMELDLARHHRMGSPIGLGGLNVEASANGPKAISDDEAARAVGGFVPLWPVLVYYTVTDNGN